MHEQVGAQCDSILSPENEVLVNQSILGGNVDIWADLLRPVPTIGRRQRTCARTGRESGGVDEVVLAIVKETTSCVEQVQI